MVFSVRIKCSRDQQDRTLALRRLLDGCLYCSIACGKIIIILNNTDFQNQKFKVCQIPNELGVKRIDRIWNIPVHSKASMAGVS